MAAHTTVEQRNELVTRFQRSGLTQREFCEAEGITVGALRSWLYKQSWKLIDVPRFVEVTAPQRRAGTEPIELRVGDVRIIVHSSITNARLVELVIALEHRKESSR